MSVDQTIRIGVIGAGNIGRAHTRQFSTMAGVEVHGVTDAIPQAAQAVQTDFSLPMLYSSPDAMLADPAIDAVIIGVPNRWHAPLAIQALQAGKHVLLEKPMAIDSAAAKDIVRAHRASGCTLMMSHQMRWLWGVQAVKDQINKGALGNIYAAKSGWFRRKGIPGWGTWFTRKEDAGGGPLIDIGVHMLDLALYLMGSPRPVSVFGSTYAEFGPKKRGIGTWGTPDWSGRYDVEDLAMALIKMDNGSTLTLDVSWAVNMDTDSQPFVHIMGADGGASIIGSRARLVTEHFDRAMETDITVPASDEGERARMSRHFIGCIRSGGEPITSGMSGLTNNLILDAIYQSSQTGREVTLDWSL